MCIRDSIDAAVDMGAITKSGAFFKRNSEVLAQGKAQLGALLKEDTKLREQLLKEIADFALPKDLPKAVSYTHLDVYKRQAQTPLFLQTDERWKNDIYAGGERDVLDCGTTIEECGCALTSMAMLLRGYGISKGATGEEIQPKSLNAYLLQNQTCTDDGCISLGYVCLLYTSRCV